jgi:AcrR family transcriptional regulator
VKTKASTLHLKQNAPTRSDTAEDKLAPSAEAILDAAEELFGGRGYGSTSVSAICAASDLPVGSIYHHFGSKAALMSAVLDRAGRRFFNELDTAVGEHPDPEDRMQRYFEQAPRLIARNANYHRIISASLQQNRDVKLLAYAHEAADQAAVTLAAVIEPVAAAAGAPNPEALALELAQMTNNYALGAGILASYDVKQLRTRMAPLYDLIRGVIDKAAKGA